MGHIDVSYYKFFEQHVRYESEYGEPEAGMVANRKPIDKQNIIANTRVVSV